MEIVTLRPITLSDTNLIVRWRNSDAVRLNMYDQKKLTAEQHQDYFHSQVESGNISQYIICAGSVPIGTAFYKNTRISETEIGLFIGEEKYRGKGIGTQALNRILLIIQKKNSYKTVFLKVKRENIHAINLYTKVGFNYKNKGDTSLFLDMIKEI